MILALYNDINHNAAICNASVNNAAPQSFLVSFIIIVPTMLS